VIATAWSEFRSIDVKMLMENMRGKNVIDPYGMLNGIELRANGFRYFRLGTPLWNPMGV